MRQLNYHLACSASTMQISKVIKTLTIDTDLIIYAFRYCLGRQTYCVLTMTEQLTKHWQELEPKDRTLIKREIRERENPIYDGNGLGDPNIDRAYWLNILELPD